LGQPIHVIEYSRVAELEAEVERLKTALEEEQWERQAATKVYDMNRNAIDTLKAKNTQLSRLNEIYKEALKKAYQDYILNNDCSGKWEQTENWPVLVEHSKDCLKCEMETALKQAEEIQK